MWITGDLVQKCTLHFYKEGPEKENKKIQTLLKWKQTRSTLDSDNVPWILNCRFIAKVEWMKWIKLQSLLQRLWIYLSTNCVVMCNFDAAYRLLCRKIVCDAIVSTYQQNVNILIVSYCETSRWQSFILPACRQTEQKDLRFSKFKQRCNEFVHSIETEIPAIVGSRYQPKRKETNSSAKDLCDALKWMSLLTG